MISSQIEVDGFRTAATETRRRHPSCCRGNGDVCEGCVYPAFPVNDLSFRTHQPRSAPLKTIITDQTKMPINLRSDTLPSVPAEGADGADGVLLTAGQSGRRTSLGSRPVFELLRSTLLTVFLLVFSSLRQTFIGVPAPVL